MSYIYDRSDFLPCQRWLRDPPSILSYYARQYTQQFKQLGAVSRKEFIEFFWSRARYMVYISNRIEDSGEGESETDEVLSELFQEYQRSGFDPRSSPPKGDQAHRETLQHGQAFFFLCIQHQNKPLTSDLIIETHRILMRNMIREDNKAVDVGRWRTTRVYVGGKACMPADQVKACMERLLRSFHALTSEESFDLPSAAAYLAYEFVDIHPFEDGNGRMSRLLLNYALLRFGLPFPCALGFKYHQHARQHYFQAVRHASAHDDNHSFLSCLVLESIICSWSEVFSFLGCPPPDIPSITDNKKLQGILKRHKQESQE